MVLGLTRRIGRTHRQARPPPTAVNPPQAATSRPPQAALPFLDYLPEGLVAKLANPPDGKLSTLALGALTPCVGAPIFEETHSRAFVLQALTSVAPLRLALPCAGLLFGAQHLQAGLVLPLAVCGYFWGVLYAFSGNLLVPVLVHAMWNARVFLGSLLAL